MDKIKQTSNSIKNWSEDDRPREKLLRLGSQSLSNAELVAILIGSGTPEVSAVRLSREILRSVDNALNKLGKLGISDLMKFRGIGHAKAITVLAALELGKRCFSETSSENVIVNTSKVIFNIMYPLIGNLIHEEFWVIYLGVNLKVLKKYQLSKGGMTSTSIDIRLIFKRALECNATSIIITHNHPSGNLKPSEIDVKITHKIKNASENLDIKLLDHVIISNNNYFSFGDEGLL